MLLMLTILYNVRSHTQNLSDRERVYQMLNSFKNNYTGYLLLFPSKLEGFLLIGINMPHQMTGGRVF